MGDTPEKFFEELAARGREPLLQDASGVLQVELVDDGRKRDWYVRINHGDVTVSRKKMAADCVMQLSRDLFEDVLRGKANVISSALRGTAKMSGNASMALQFQRLFRGPPRSVSKTKASRRVA